MAIGVFDGVHLGHQALLKACTAQARMEGIRSLAFSFHPHPAALFTKTAPLLLEPIETRLSHFEHYGMDCALIENFDRAFAELSAQQFMEEVLHEKLCAHHVVVGEDFVFGKGARGNMETLKAGGKEYGFSVHGIPPVRVAEQRVSSTSLRNMILLGEVQKAALHLGRFFEIAGTTHRGAGRGEGIGFPTANMHSTNQIVPAQGVYATRLDCGGQSYNGVTNIGHAPTFGDNPLSIETHILDFESRPLYGEPMSVAFVARLRNEITFRDVDALKAQIVADVSRARALFQNMNERS